MRSMRVDRAARRPHQLAITRTGRPQPIQLALARAPIVSRASVRFMPARNYLAPLVTLALLDAIDVANSRAQSPSPPRPNIVHIFADDLGWGNVGFNGQQQIQTPTLDSLAAAGM